MTWITQLHQRSMWLLLLIALVLSLSLVACGKQANASSTNSPNNNTVSLQEQYRPNAPAQSPLGNTNANTTINLQNTDQQVQRIMRQLDGAHNDVNSSDAASSQDNGQQP